MNKKIIFITLLIFLIFILINFNFFVWSYHFLKANSKYNTNNFTWALSWYIKTLDYMTWTNIKYNIWNTHYKIWEWYNNLDQKTFNYIIALKLYEDILNKDKNDWKKEDSDVRYNYDYVKKKFEELQEQNKEEQKEKQDNDDDKNDKNENKWKQDKNNNEDNVNEENNDTKDGNDNTNESKEKQNQEWNNEESNENIEKDSNPKKENWDNSEEVDSSDLEKEEWSESNEEDNLSKDFKQINLSESDIKWIKGYIDKLKDEEKSNREYLNVNKKEVDPFFDSFFGRWWEKDW